MSPETHYKIEELEELTGLSRRLIYDYISRDLVPAARGSGKGAYYMQEHLDRLRLISLLRTIGFRLERIEEAITTWSSEEIARVVKFAEGRDVESLDALNQWLTSPSPSELRARERSKLESEAAIERLMAAAAAPQASRASLEEAPAEPVDLENARAELGDKLAEFAEPAEEATAEDALDSLLFARMKSRARDAGAAAQEPPAQSMNQLRDSAAAPRHRVANLMQNLMPADRAAASSPTRRETWHRIRIAPDIELSYRNDIDPDRRSVLEELIARVKEVFGR
ncbi:MAG: MerR family transcriptional regulator [Acidobacteriota bacterium]|jgi:DNA-binding transcriptional MerR regulator